MKTHRTLTGLLALVAVTCSIAASAADSGPQKKPESIKPAAETSALDMGRLSVEASQNYGQIFIALQASFEKSCSFMIGEHKITASGASDIPGKSTVFFSINGKSYDALIPTTSLSQVTAIKVTLDLPHGMHYQPMGADHQLLGGAYHGLTTYELLGYRLGDSSKGVAMSDSGGIAKPLN